MSRLSELFSCTGYITVSRPLIREIGLDAAVMFGELSSKSDFYESRDELTEDGFFFQVAEDIETSTGLSPFRQNKALDVLAKYGMVVTSIRGLPAKKYYRVCSEQALQFFESLDVKNLKALIYTIPCNKNRDNKNRERRECPIPSVEEVADYIKEKGYTFDAEVFWAYYHSQHWKKANGLPLYDWKSACVAWQQKEKTAAKPRKTRSEVEQDKISDMMKQLKERGVKFDEEEDES